MGCLLAIVLFVAIVAISAKFTEAGVPEAGGSFFIGAMGLLCIGFLVSGNVMDWLRTRRLRRLAEELQFEFRPKSSALKARMRAADFLCFGLLDVSHQIRNVLSGEYASFEITLFDYRYQMAAKIRSHSVFYIHAPGLSLPQFKAEPEVWWSPRDLFIKMLRCVAMMLGRDGDQVPIYGDSAFMTSYVVCGKDQDAIRRIFTREAQEFLAKKHYIVEGSGDHLIVYRRKVLQNRKGMLRLFRDGAQLCWYLNSPAAAAADAAAAEQPVGAV